MKNRNKKVAKTGKYTVNYIYDIVKTSLTQDPYQFFLTQYSEEKAHQIINAWLRELNRKHIELYGGRPWAKED